MLTPESITELEQRKAQLSELQTESLERQKYRVVGTHSAVKTCGWTRNMINGEGGCYKLKFYGIMSHQCLQMTTSISCANRCTFCWRGYKAPVSKEWTWEVDEPEMIVEKSLEAHHKLLVGYGGSDKANKQAYETSKTVKHVALSLTGEPIIYPKMNELLDKFHKDGVSTFIVTNGQYPEQVKDLKPITQLYISVDAPNKELLKEVDKPLFADYWERLLLALDYLAEKKARTCIRLTLIKSINDVEPENYANLIKRSDADFIEVKGYMHVGESRERLGRRNMPIHEEIIKFTQKMMLSLEDYEIVSEHIPSRVIMVAKKKFKKEDGWYTWIDFPKFEELANSGKEFTSDDYLKKTPNTGLSGKGTWNQMQDHIKEKFLKENKHLFVDEETNELSFYEN
ncbi:4-demethylwyosine synthase TYW1 [Candidatus Woesearchaeota archaeon]|nr:4-demethylwyosine synthase TYW1 [Candidatus Woesearchaeota archaeon]MBT4150409.1 4-demethylwyosine synthase TYW1 [Candidatus Woesearchaeota archaeon]MBT4246979.1 4-demethylwyosine synthase TYW1 [Candidatus Woesearchaeota archaeon]MBT4434536.1 4-demethylwyosine synthase TYW1 [Candidatus Woesearchaeota archaeon]MBT7331718.1 4-demethylwyosine synthase TYW1 [Candidatus Woesearchaeota archaeon]